MSDDSSLPEVIKEPTTDIIGKDADDLKSYVEAGMPDVGSVNQEELGKMFDLYLSGKNYRQISGIMRKKKEVVLFLSHRLQWFEKRRELVSELENTMKSRIMEVRLKSQDVMINFLETCNREFTVKMNSQVVSGERAENQINLKKYEIYLKTQALLMKSIETPTPKGPLVGINVGDGATVTRTGDNTIEVTPNKQSVKSNMLKEYADMRRKEEKG